MLLHSMVMLGLSLKREKPYQLPRKRIRWLRMIGGLEKTKKEKSPLDDTSAIRNSDS